MLFWLIQALSYPVNFLVYAWFFSSWKMSLIICLLLIWHECGHLYTAKFLGYKSKGILLIPLFGGLTFIVGPHQKYSNKAAIALAGPVSGLLQSVLCYLAYMISGSNVWGVAACIIAIVNLFNLIPLSFFDGGQVLESITYSISKKTGMIAMNAVLIIALPVTYYFNQFLFIALMLFAPSMVIKGYHRWKASQLVESEIPDPISMSEERMWLAAGVYLLTVLCLFGMTELSLHHLHLTLSGLFAKR